MSARNTALILIVLALAGLSVYLNLDRFRRDSIQIGHRFEHPRGALARRFGPTNTNVLIFILNAAVPLKSVRVIADRPGEKTSDAHTLWELLSDSNSVPVKDVVYGRMIPGMRAGATGKTAEPLEPGVKYKLLLTSGSRKAEHEFTGEAAP
ncbi:MAG: hypothetical protein U1F98_16500 [Verrucomicrobiota bacterium]